MSDDVVSPTEAQQVHRADGVTASERYLNKLCDRSFLTLWSYPGVYRDQRNNKNVGEGKELCDVLVVFENHIIIFSDKDCKFPDTGNLQTDWQRWYRKSIAESAKQVFGAERWLKSFPEKVFLDRNCAQPFPISIPAPTTAQYHRIVVARGCAERCRQYFSLDDASSTGSGSLIIDSTVCGDAHFADFGSGGKPFVVGKVDPDQGYVHVFDETTLDILLEQLDTAADFVAYLMKKEHFLTTHAIVAAGEEELLGCYLGHVNDEGEHDFSQIDGNVVFLYTEGHWLSFLNSRERAAQIEANRISYLWDDVIERSSERARSGASELCFSDHEKLLRFFAREPRIRRRMLARSVLDMARIMKPDYHAKRLVEPSSPGDPYFLLLMSPVPSFLVGQPGYEDEYRAFRKGYLEAYCMATKVFRPDAQVVIGFATGPGYLPCETSEELIFLDATTWTEENQKETEKVMQELSIFVNTTEIRGKELEYPVVRQALSPKASKINPKIKRVKKKCRRA